MPTAATTAAANAATLLNIPIPASLASLYYRAELCTTAFRKAYSMNIFSQANIEYSPTFARSKSIGDLFNVKGRPTLTGSCVLVSAPPTTQDALIVQRRRQAGTSIIGKTDMTDFVFSGLDYGRRSECCNLNRHRRLLPNSRSFPEGIGFKTSVCHANERLVADAIETRFVPSYRDVGILTQVHAALKSTPCLAASCLDRC